MPGVRTGLAVPAIVLGALLVLGAVRLLDREDGERDGPATARTAPATAGTAPAAAREQRDVVGVPAEALLRAARDGEHHAHPALGVAVVDVSELGGLDLPVDEGALVTGVSADGPAQRAGLRAGTVLAEIGGRDVPVGGDVIVACDGHDVEGAEDLRERVVDAGDRAALRLTVVRGEQRREVRVRPAPAAAGDTVP